MHEEEDVFKREWRKEEIERGERKKMRETPVLYNTAGFDLQAFDFCIFPSFFLFNHWNLIKFSQQ